MGTFPGIIASELRNLKFDGIAGSDFMIDKGIVVEARNIHNGCEWHILVDYTKDITHARQNNHNVDFDNETDDCLEQADEERWIGVCEVFIMVDGVLHHGNSCSDILLYVDVHKCRSNESRNHHIKSLDWPNGKALVCLSILPDAHNHHNLYELDNNWVHEDIRSLCFWEVHSQKLFLQINCESHRIRVICQFEVFHFAIIAVVDALNFDSLRLLEFGEQGHPKLLFHGRSSWVTVFIHWLVEQRSVKATTGIHFHHFLNFLFVFCLLSSVLVLLLPIVVQLIKSDVEGQQDIEWNPDLDVVGGLLS